MMCFWGRSTGQIPLMAFQWRLASGVGFRCMLREVLGYDYCVLTLESRYSGPCPGPRERERGEGEVKESNSHSGPRDGPVGEPPRCATPGQSEAAATWSQSQGSPIMAPKCPLESSGVGGGGGGSRQTGEMDDEIKRGEENWPVAGSCMVPPFPIPSLSRHPGKEVPEIVAGHWQTANTMPSQAWRGLRSEGRRPRGSFGGAERPIFQSRAPKITTLDEWCSPKRCSPGRPPSLALAAATGGGYSWELEPRNNGRAYCHLFWLPCTV